MKQTEGSIFPVKPSMAVTPRQRLSLGTTGTPITWMHTLIWIISRVVVVGIGNVAMDVARVLAKSTDELAKTDISDYALESLRKSRVKEIVILGRRGRAQAAFHAKGNKGNWGA